MLLICRTGLGIIVVIWVRLWNRDIAFAAVGLFYLIINEVKIDMLIDYYEGCDLV